MVLKMADLGRCPKSFQTLWKSSYRLANGILSAFEVVSQDFRWIRKGPKSADFEQKAWAIAHGFENGGFWQVPDIVPNSLKSLNRLPKWFLSSFGLLSQDFRWIRKGPKSADFEQKAWAIAHGFEHGGFWQVPEIVPNFLKSLLHSCKWFTKYFRGC